MFLISGHFIDDQVHIFSPKFLQFPFGLFTECFVEVVLTYHCDRVGGFSLDDRGCYSHVGCFDKHVSCTLQEKVLGHRLDDFGLASTSLSVKYLTQ